MGLGDFKPDGLRPSNLAIFFLIKCNMIHNFSTKLSVSYISRGDNSFDHPVYKYITLFTQKHGHSLIKSLGYPKEKIEIEISENENAEES